MTRRNVRKQGWVFPFSRWPIEPKYSQVCYFIYKLWYTKFGPLDSTVYRKCQRALKRKWFLLRFTNTCTRQRKGRSYFLTMGCSVLSLSLCYAIYFPLSLAHCFQKDTQDLSFRWSHVICNNIIQSLPYLSVFLFFYGTHLVIFKTSILTWCT